MKEQPLSNNISELSQNENCQPQKWPALSREKESEKEESACVYVCVCVCVCMCVCVCVCTRQLSVLGSDPESVLSNTHAGTREMANQKPAPSSRSQNTFRPNIKMSEIKSQAGKILICTA